MPLDDTTEDFQNNEITYEVYGNEVVAIAFMGDKQMAFDWYYESGQPALRKKFCKNENCDKNVILKRLEKLAAPIFYSIQWIL